MTGMSDDTNETDDAVLDEWTWTHEGMRCRIIKHRLGHYCGYVRTLFDDRWYYDEFQGWPHSLIEVIGGLTYGVDKDGWIGFDCGHAFDVCVDADGEPWGVMSEYRGGLLRDDRDMVVTWTLDDVKQHTNELAQQMRAIHAFAELVVQRQAEEQPDVVGDGP